MAPNEIQMICDWLERIEKKIDQYSERLNIVENDIRNLYDGLSKEKIQRLKCKEDEDIKINSLAELTAPTEEVHNIIGWIKKRWYMVIFFIVLSGLIVLGLSNLLNILPPDKIADIIKFLTKR